MVYGVWGTQLARISVVDLLDELVLDEIVRPEENNPIVDCNTRFSGLTKEQIDTAKYDLQGVQKKLFELVNSETILIGHSLESDLKALRIVHLKVVDTSVVFPHQNYSGGRRWSRFERRRQCLHETNVPQGYFVSGNFHSSSISLIVSTDYLLKSSVIITKNLFICLILQTLLYICLNVAERADGAFLGGAIGGTAGTAVTCPLEVIKTRLQSSRCKTRLGAGKFILDICRTEGVRSLYKGLIPNLIGVTPSKAVYFLTYSQSKYLWNNSGILVPNSAAVHMTSAGLGGKFLTATIINPVWLVKTRLQLHQGHLGLLPCIKRIYANEGIKGFYKGVTASYVGISETIIQFVVYEYLRARLDEADAAMDEDTKFYKFMVIGGMAKFCACITTYPHEVVRTRLREEGSEARGFWKTLRQVWREGRFSSCYRGVSVQLMRSVPNTAITMGTYELVVSLLHSYLRKPEEESSR
uniref:Exonuclease domain-containing protein n=1 Tax=Ditylenchus dipsaci TaxID=166011 RepID=A0A915DM57_9BILA